MLKITVVSLVLLLLLLGVAESAKDTSNDLKKGQSATELISTIFSLLKDEVTSRGLARLDASLKSVLGNSVTGLVYAASLAVGVITLLAFYESPISPLPVPSLPKPPVGRFPPEHAVWPPISKHPVKVGPGPAYAGAGAASNQHLQFVLPAGMDKIPNQAPYVGGYEKANIGQNNFGLNNGIEHGFGGHMNVAASNLYQQVVPSQHKRVAAAQPGRPLSSQLPVIQRKTGHVESALDAASSAVAASEPKVSVTSAEAAEPANANVQPISSSEQQ
jgi:hypothetical protein